MTQEDIRTRTPVANGYDLTNAESLRAHYGAPNDRAVAKQIDRLDRHCKAFIKISPFVVVSTASSDGRVDSSPKGDAPGFVRVLDDRTIAIPDRIGNNRIDGMLNIVSNPHVGLLFMVPGMNETLRINGTVRISHDPELLDSMCFKGRPPKTAMVVTAEEVFLHCGKAFIRSGLWNPENRIERQSFPTLGQMLADQIDGLDPTEADRATEDGYKNRLY
ncbi:MAG: pyridoxamine 5'-phosphate oxidase family protein [Pirellulales bacterium]|nr:pyridoxamine 5'-phosphate oxidase family protein [Pirellulales bacterium]